MLPEKDVNNQIAPSSPSHLVLHPPCGFAGDLFLRPNESPRITITGPRQSTKTFFFFFFKSLIRRSSDVFFLIYLFIHFISGCVGCPFLCEGFL